MGALTRRETQGFIAPDRRSGDRGNNLMSTTKATAQLSL